MLIAIEKITTRNKKGNLVIFEPGNEVKGLEKQDEQRLISLNVAFSTETEEELKKNELEDSL